MREGKWRPLRHRLSDEAVALMAEEVASGLTPLPVHMMLVDDSGPRERGETACGGGLGEWVTGDGEQVTCRPCLETVHA
jgi:hypothetical protein